MISIAILGFGVVGGGVADVLTKNRDTIEKRTGVSFRIAHILDLREFPDSPFAPIVTKDYGKILSDPDVNVVVECMGGSHPAYDFTKAALEAGKSVVTSNKEVVANFGVELLALAKKNGVSYLFEASVGGGIPCLHPISYDLRANRLCRVCGILNGTTNFILTAMEKDGSDFSTVLAEAKRLGYAEANPAADVEGLDAARKTVILTALACGKLPSPDSIPVKGITEITAEDSAIAKAAGYALKLIGDVKIAEDGRFFASVSPTFVPAEHPLASVNGVNNAVFASGNMVGSVMFYGPGAGKLPTASAVVADVIRVMEGSTECAVFPWETAADADRLSPAEVRGKVAVLHEKNVKIVGAPVATLGDTALTVVEETTVSDAEKLPGAKKVYPIL